MLLSITPADHAVDARQPACNLPAPSASIESEAAKHPERQGWEEKDHANVNFAKSLGIGAGIAVAFLLLMIAFRSTRLGEVFLGNAESGTGWVNWTETFLFCWGLTILFMKWKMIQHQERATLLELFPERIGKEITTDTIGPFIDNIYQVPLSLRDSLMVNRIRKAGNESYLWAAGRAETQFRLKHGKLPMPNDGKIDLSLFFK